MKITTITVGSVTYAIKVKKMLLGIGIKPKLIKVDSSKSKNGCEYGVQIPSSLFLDAVAALKKHQIYYSVYSEDES